MLAYIIAKKVVNIACMFLLVLLDFIAIYFIFLSNPICFCECSAKNVKAGSIICNAVYTPKAEKNIQL